MLRWYRRLCKARPKSLNITLVPSNTTANGDSESNGDAAAGTSGSGSGDNDNSKSSASNTDSTAAKPSGDKNVAGDAGSISHADSTVIVGGSTTPDTSQVDPGAESRRSELSYYRF